MRARESRLEHDTAALRDLAAHTFGRLQLVYCDPTYIKLRMNCRSATMADNLKEPMLGDYEHRIDLFIPPVYPAEPVVALHKHPTHIFHPNIAAWSQGSDPLLVRRLMRGFICYSGHHSPGRTLVDVVRQLYDVIGYRAGRFSTNLSDCLNKEAVVWANQMAETNLFPLERRPLRTAENKA